MFHLNLHSVTGKQFPLRKATRECPGSARGEGQQAAPGLTEHLNIVEYECSSSLAHPIVRHAAVGPRVLLISGVNQEVAEQEPGLVVARDIGAILGPSDPWRWDPTGHTFQDEALTLGDDDGLSLCGVDYPSCLCHGAWGRHKRVLA